MTDKELLNKFREVRQTYEPSDHSTLSPYEAKQCTIIALEHTIEALKDLIDDTGNTNFSHITTITGQKAKLKIEKYQKQLEQLKTK